MSRIEVTNLGKAYKVYPSHWARLKEWMIPFSKPRHELKWVLQDISFTVEPGEAVGIVGINGAGKSTLLKMITGTTQPTTGAVTINGRVSALLELGMGFHPDFTGRQNAYMAGQLLGLSVEEIGSLMPEIEAFAEIGEYIDQPVRVYSSGMQMRLAFSVATARRPDILIVDEALSVGDAYFQHKSFDRIRNFRKEGTTLLIVSHDKQAIQSICDSAIVLNAGRLAMQGDPESVMNYYNAKLADHQNQIIQQIEICNRIQTISGLGDATVSAIRLLDEDNRSVKTIQVCENITLEIQVKSNSFIPRLVLGFLIKDRFGQSIFGTNTEYLSCSQLNADPSNLIIYSFTFPANLGPGIYSISTALANSSTHVSKNYEWRDLAFIFEVITNPSDSFTGVAYLPVKVICKIKNKCLN
jgi:lipopolysaccharide transport system ATP-binding protein